MKAFRGNFGESEARHLLLRTGFFATPEMIQRAVAAGLESTIEGLLSKEKPADALADRVDAGVRHSNDRGRLASGWIHRALTTKEPLRENLVLFFHNHFVSALSKVLEGKLLLDQLELFRTMAFGPFEELVIAVGRDPAMVRYLDSEQSTRAAPNENYARELLELFTVGKGNYTEADIRSAARAYTGYHLVRGLFEFRPSAHDDGAKEFLGHRGPFRGDDVARIAATADATATTMAEKLLRHFACNAPDGEAIASLAQTLRREKGHLGRTLQQLLCSELFFEPKSRRALTRSPAHLAVGTGRALGGGLAPAEVARHVTLMGQTLLDPPSVKGYAGGESWLNPATHLARRSFLSLAASARGASLDVADDTMELARYLLGSTLPTEIASAIDHACAELPPEARRIQRTKLVLFHPDYQSV